ncbi:hypothetical protein [Sphingomonas sp.]|uniref:DUF4139 domain-containing protein n=1 Tax=Sphingomonas sp. TaxID=28214 RepID=UPI0031D34DA0
MRWLLLLMLCLPALAHAQGQTVTSSEVSDVAVTIYRDPYRDAGMMQLGWPGGYALITETRTVTIPRGESRLRFENVAEGLLPETAIVTGLPSGVREKNRDARLISPAGLVDAFLKRRVRIRRTDPATGRVREQSAIIQSGPDGGVLIRTDQGFEALRCSGLPERMIYPEVPDTLSARPTLSILTRSERAVTATIQLTYMAQGFDWSANYVGNMAADGRKMGLFAWLTVANGGQQSFKDARLQVIAGKPNKRPNNPPPPPPASALNLQCWPLDTTSTHPRREWERLPMPPGPDLSRFDAVGRNAPGSFETRKQRREREKRARYAGGGAEDIVVTGSRIRRLRLEAPMAVTVVSADYAMPAPAPPPPAPPPPPPPGETVAVAQGAQAQAEALGDLKLYRVPMRVTVAAQSQKQVAMLVQPEARFDRIYRANVATGRDTPQPMPFLLRSTNVGERGLGVPLPAGGLALFETVAGRRLLAGRDDVADLAVGEEVELALGQSPDVQWKLTRVRETADRQEWRVDITNARNVPVTAQIVVPNDLAEKPPGIERGRGGWVLPVEVPDNGTATLGYALKLSPRR